MFLQKLTRSTTAPTGGIIAAIAISVILSSHFPTGTLWAQTLAHSAPNQRVEGTVPANWSPGTGTIITGEAADKAKAAAMAKYPGGTVNRVLKLNDGSYAVHMIKVRWPHHVFVDKDFKVSGAIG